MPRLPPQEGLPPPLCIPPLASSEDALYVVNRTLHLLIKPDNLTCYQHGVETACRGMITSAAIGWQAELERVRLIQAFAAFFNHYDLLLTPCVPIAPFTAGHGINTPDASAYPEWYDWTPYTWVFNAAKLPAASCPWGLNAAGLPQAVQLAATHFREDLVLRASAVLEATMPVRHPNDVLWR